MLFVCSVIWEYFENIELYVISLVEKIKLCFILASSCVAVPSHSSARIVPPVSMHSIVIGFGGLNLAFWYHCQYFLVVKISQIATNRCLIGSIFIKQGCTLFKEALKHRLFLQLCAFSFAVPHSAPHIPQCFSKLLEALLAKSLHLYIPAKWGRAI